MRRESRWWASVRTTSPRTRISATSSRSRSICWRTPIAELLKAAGVGQTDYNGTKYWNRTSFVIDPKGNLRKVYEKVNPHGHEKVLLDDIKAMQKG